MVSNQKYYAWNRLSDYVYEIRETDLDVILETLCVDKSSDIRTLELEHLGRLSRKSQRRQKSGLASQQRSVRSCHPYPSYLILPHYQAIGAGHTVEFRSDHEILGRVMFSSR